MPGGKAAGVRCAQLGDDNLCRIFGSTLRPAVCRGLQPSPEMCGKNQAQAIWWLGRMEHLTAPGHEASSDEPADNH
jgi:hypothetical protein